jgi:hypothetical protein
MNKKVTFAPKPTSVPPAHADAWVSGAPAEKAEEPRMIEPTEKTKRFTFDVSESLHRRVKAKCAEKGVDMADEMRRILMEHFPQP